MLTFVDSDPCKPLQAGYATSTATLPSHNKEAACRAPDTLGARGPPREATVAQPGRTEATSPAGLVVVDLSSDPRCKQCRIDDDEPALLCDSCDGVFHLHCLNPPLDKVSRSRVIHEQLSHSNIAGRVASLRARHLPPSPSPHPVRQRTEL